MRDVSAIAGTCSLVPVKTQTSPSRSARVDSVAGLHWTPNGAAICTVARDQWYPQLASDGAGGAILAWQDYRTGVADIYGQRVNAVGAGQWGVGGAVICDAADQQYSPVIAADGLGGAIVAWQDYRAAGIADIYAQRVNAASAGQWGGNGLGVCTAAQGQYAPALLPDGAGGTLVAWEDFRSGDYAIYAATNNDLLIVAGDAQTLQRALADVNAMPGVARELRRVHVNSVSEIEIRRLGGKQSLAPMFLSYGVPANSDFHPYLDLHAAKHRFLSTSAQELTGLLGYSVPIVALLEGRAKNPPVESKVDGEEYLEALELTRRAHYARDFLLLQTPPQPVAIPRQFQKDLELTRARVIECRDPGRSDIWFHSLYQLARTLNPMLSAQEAGAVWERIEHGACSSLAAPDERQWIDLMKAVGNRAAPEMARLAEALLARPSDLPAGHRKYLMAAGMAGYLAQGKRAEAGALWNRYPKDADGTDDIGLRLLHAHAFPPQ